MSAVNWFLAGMMIYAVLGAIYQAVAEVLLPKIKHWNFVREDRDGEMGLGLGVQALEADNSKERFFDLPSRWDK